MASGEFLEFVELYGNHYGTSQKWVEEQQKKGRHVILTIDTQGAQQLLRKVKAVYIFLKPPSSEILRQRLEKRRTETDAMVEQRLAWSQKEIEVAGHYDYNIINDDLETAYQVLKSIIVAEEHRVSNANL
jgi:guanylate kinase